ncbi:MAG: hypothetical protein ACHQQQ_13265 [Bacteroidota bacterium]
MSKKIVITSVQEENNKIPEPIQNRGWSVIIVSASRFASNSVKDEAMIKNTFSSGPEIIVNWRIFLKTINSPNHTITKTIMENTIANCTYVLFCHNDIIQRRKPISTGRNRLLNHKLFPWNAIQIDNPAPRTLRTR